MKLSVAAVVLIAAMVIGYIQVGGPDDADIAAERAYIDIDTGNVFSHVLRTGDMEPIKSPSGKMSGYRAEACYWGKGADGKWFIKDKPTYVVLKNRIDPESTEPTFCPDCGRRVVGHNPKPNQSQVDAANASGESGAEASDSDERDR